MRTTIAIVALMLAGLLAGAAAASAQEPLKIGVLTDEGGPFSTLSGEGSVEAARMAVEDFGGTVLGRTVEVIDADHQNKPDVGLGIARRWFENEHVAVIVDLANSAVALGVQELARQEGRLSLTSTSGSADLTGKACSPLGAQWTWDTYAVAVAPVRALIAEGYDSWFFITADFAFGAAMQRDAERAIRDGGGKVLGSVKHPLNTSDFASYLLQAQASGAKVVAFANGGSDTINAVKQAAEFGLTAKGTKLAAFALNITDIHSLGLATAQGIVFVEGFYWDRDDAARAWSRRFFARRKAMPSQMQAGVYSAVASYLKAVQAAGTADAAKVMAQLRALPVHDFFAPAGRLRVDGRMVHDMYLVQVKTPAESTGDWDYYKILRTIPGEQAFRPLADSECPLVKTRQ
ncbi:MAG TPA: ABC transporter substrate-binding protein [Stellaceae bacterium]|nr:ABC transporter substrate-binding protein [Stellaceae bacterium]